MVEYVTQHPSGGYILDELHVGMAAEKTVHVTEDRIRLFAEASDDFNPVHLDEAFASKTAYRGRIAHGLLSAAFGSAVVGTILPGAGSIYISQTLSFHFPVRIDDMVRIVARQLKLPTRAELSTEDLERAILFKVMERSLERMSEEQKRSLTDDVKQSLRKRGIDREVGFSEVLKFVKFAGMDVGGTVGTLAMAGPGLAGTIGLNALQFIVLKGIILSSGYMAAGGALLGFGFGGALLTLAGAAGPVGVALGVLYTAYSLSGPAFRKLIPAICVIAAKRVEIGGTEHPSPGGAALD